MHALWVHRRALSFKRQWGAAKGKKARPGLLPAFYPAFLGLIPVAPCSLLGGFEAFLLGFVLAGTGGVFNNLRVLHRTGAADREMVSLQMI